MQLDKAPSSPNPVDQSHRHWTSCSKKSRRRRGMIFLFGVGLEGLMMKGLCMRLAHLGLSAHCVFDMTRPPISSSDLLIVSAGPGGFPIVNAICGIARSNKARIVFLTAQPESVSVQEYASVAAYIPAQTMVGDEDDGKLSGRELLHMGSVFEGAMFVLFEMVVYRLGESLGQNPEDIRSCHTNLECGSQQHHPSLAVKIKG